MQNQTFTVKSKLTFGQLISRLTNLFPLKCIYLDNCKLNDSQLEEVAGIIATKHSGCLTLSLSKNNLTSLDFLAPILEHDNLKHLYVDSNYLTTAGIKSFTNMLSYCQSLCIIDIRNNEINDEGVNMLLDNIKLRDYTNRCIDIRGNRYSSNTNVRWLKLRNNTLMIDYGGTNVGASNDELEACREYLSALQTEVISQQRFKQELSEKSERKSSLCHWIID